MSSSVFMALQRAWTASVLRSMTRKRALIGGLTVVAVILLVSNMWAVEAGYEGLKADLKLKISGTKPPAVVEDSHPIRRLMQDADKQFEEYLKGRPLSFADTVLVYRQKWGRNPPPGFDKWYKFAKDRNCYHYDDFDQINHDLRPFWALSPKDLRRLVRGILEEDVKKSHLAGFHIRNGKVSLNKQTVGKENFRTDTFQAMLKVFSHELPDMDVVMNRLDQPRIVVPWEDIQRNLEIEVATRNITEPSETLNKFSKNEEVTPTKDDIGLWEGAAGKPYMNIAARGCPPESYARNPGNESIGYAAVQSYLLPHEGGLVMNFNLSSDLCTVGPLIQDKHGFLYVPSSISATKKLLPVFGESKVNVNNEILFPANMYYTNDKRYIYDGSLDFHWSKKETKLLWRGITSGGVQTEESWDKMHRHRLVQMTNATYLRQTGATYEVFNADSQENPDKYTSGNQFSPAMYAEKIADIGFTELAWCVPNPDCGFLKPYFHEVPKTTLAEQFKNRYLIDVDGHSFSGRWESFLRSRSMGLKATIFREWHDSRIFAWKHFAPLDNSFKELYSVMTYFTGLGKEYQAPDGSLYVPPHPNQAEKMADASREWANKVLRREDIEIYMFRLFLEYARLLDDNRDIIGYAGDGGELD